MLVLSRNPDQSIMCRCADGKEIEIRVLSVKGKSVRIGVEADESIVVNREEIWHKIEMEQEAKAE